jgi:hypothetical protein
MGEHMLKQYEILTTCLKELGLSSLLTIEKLKLEVQLFQTGHILLNDDVEIGVTGATESEQEFYVLHEHVRHVCNTSCTGDEVEDLMLHLQNIKEGLTIHKNMNGTKISSNYNSMNHNQRARFIRILICLTIFFLFTLT